MNSLNSEVFTVTRTDCTRRRTRCLRPYSAVDSVLYSGVHTVLQYMAVPLTMPCEFVGKVSVNRENSVSSVLGEYHYLQVRNESVDLPVLEER